MIGRLIKDESGMTMALVVIMVVLIGVMGAGLLTFVQRDLHMVIEDNRGQQALEVADAGIQAAKQQLINDNIAKWHYDGFGTDDLSWSYCYGVSGCTSTSPTSTGSSGMRINMDNGNYANVTILMTSYSPATYKTISVGRVGEAQRKIEATFQSDPKVGMPAAYFTRGGITLTGTSNLDGISFFALRDIDVNGSWSLGTANDTYFGKWATTSGNGPYPNAFGSFPNAYNVTPRASALGGLATSGTITGTSSAVAKAFKNTRSYDSTTNPKVPPDTDGDGTPNYDADGVAGQGSGEIGFPFRVSTPTEDRQEIIALRDRALELERTLGGQYYIDSIPGNGVDDAGMASRTSSCSATSNLPISSWPAGSTYETVRFYKFQSYSNNNCVYYGVNTDNNCSSSSVPINMGVIVVENGNMLFEGNRRFDGAIVVRAYDASGALMGDSAGTLSGSGNPCLYGYANTSGHMTVAGTITPGSSPELGGLASFRGSVEQISWRELYQ